MNRILAMYKVSMKISLASAMSYRADFVFNAIISLLSNLLIPLVTLLIYGSGASIPGWSLYEALLIQSVFMLSTGLCTPFFYNMVWITMEHIKNGSYDLMLIKPCPVIATTMALGFDIDSIGTLLGGVAMFIVAVCHTPLDGFWAWLLFAVFLVMGIAVLLGMICIMAASAFKWVGNSRIFEIYSSVSQFGRYPATIFPRALFLVVSYILPVSMLGFFPAAALLGKADPAFLFAIIPCVAFMLFGIWLFGRMVRLYQSAGG